MNVNCYGSTNMVSVCNVVQREDMSVIIALIILVIYLASPLIGKAVLLLINTVIHDPIPYVDEIIMWIGLAQHLDRVLCIVEYIQDHKKTVKKVAIIAGVGILLVVFLVITA